MSKATLERFEIEATPKVSEETMQLAIDASLILGYDALLDSIVGSGRESLSSVLRRLDIQPYDWDTVKRYKEAAREKAEKSAQKKDPEGRFHSFYWNETKIKGLNADVPPFVLRKAIQIKRACPEAKILVQYLAEEEDPFLVVELGKERFCIEVWDEDDFDD